MIENEKVIIYTGPTKAFNEFTMKFYERDKNNYNLTKLVNLSENERNTLLVKIQGQEQKRDSNFEENAIDLLTVSSNEYSGVTEAVTSNFVNYISKYNISKLIIQNPPIEIINDLKKQFDEKDIGEYNHDYGKIDNKLIVNFKKDCNSVILGQEDALEKVIQSLIIQQKLNKEDKPIVIMLYGPSGVGKTETGRLLAKLLGEEMFYSQFSMFQNEGHLNYLYGDKIQAPSFAKDLLKRTSNIIFLDEFDKANRFVYSALYQMFDTGEFEDNNFHVNLKNTLIICTSNYENPQKIYEHLGEPMFFRINCFIKYQQLSIDVKIKLIDKYYNKLIEQLDTEEKQIINNSKIKDKYIKIANELDNARQIENFIRNDIAKELVRNLK